MDFYKELKTAAKTLRKIRKILGTRVVENVMIDLSQKQITIKYYDDVLPMFGPEYLAKALDAPRKRIVTKNRVLTLMKYKEYTIANFHCKDEIAAKNAFRDIEEKMDMVFTIR